VASVGETARERDATRALRALPGGQWHLMHDVRCTLRRLANVDHIVVGRAGVCVIDTRNWMGRLEVDAQVLTQDGDGREATLDRVVESSQALSDVIPGLDPQVVVPVLCFNRDEPISGWARDVLVCTAGNVVDVLTSQRRLLDPAEVDRMFDLVSWSMPSATYSIGEPSGEARNLHRLEGRARTRWLRWKGSSAKHLA
jgi:hypothetical protein